MSESKEKVLRLLKENANSYLSGQDIADRLYITRAGIWKIIKSLREEGYDIDSVTNRGYRLNTSLDCVNASFIGSHLSGLKEAPKCFVFDEVTSTNDVAKNLLSKENADGDILVIADSQTEGRGRKGRVFFSPKDTGLYISLLTHPEIPFSKATAITCIAAESLVLAVKDVLDIDVSIKWVNDIFYGDKKVAGILTETFGSLEEEYPEYVITGIGINIYPFSGKLPSEIKNKAGYLISGGKPVDNLKNLLCVKFIEYFYHYLKEADDKTFLEGYRKHSNLIGKYVKINSYGRSSKNEYALVTGIDDECRLTVLYDDSKEAALVGKEVSVVKY